MRMLNLGILAHVDAGKTSLTERLLFDAGVIPALGAVDQGSTQTDAMDLERRRGITIRSAVATFTVGDHQLQLIDTPGHADFVAEVERALGVLDGAVLVVSAVEGVQAQTRVLMRTLTALRVPTLLFVNKIDRAGARGEGLLADLARLLSPAVVPLNVPSGLGDPGATVRPREPGPELAEVLAERDERVLESYVDDPGALTGDRLRGCLREQARAGLVYPVYFGSARTGAGMAGLRQGITEFLPAASANEQGPLEGTVFAMEREPGGGRSAVVRLFSGSLGARDVVSFTRRTHSGAVERKTGKVTAVRAAGDRPGRVPAGGIAYLSGLRGIRVGDRLGTRTAAAPATAHFRPPTMETVVTPREPGGRTALFLALTELSEQDPWIDLRRVEGSDGVTVSLYGEVQREVIAARLAEEFGVPAEFSAPRVVCIERPAGTGSALEEMGQAPFVATVGLRVEPGPAGGGVRFELEAERGSLPPAFMQAIEDTVHRTLREGLHGWQVVDCRVTLTHTGYASPVTVAADLRGLTPLVLMTALRAAGTVVCEPRERVELDLPTAALSPVLAAVTRCGGLPGTPELSGESCALTAVLPTARLRELERQLPGLTAGSGMLTSRFAGYHPVSGRVPSRPRTDHNPLHREEYLRNLLGG